MATAKSLASVLEPSAVELVTALAFVPTAVALPPLAWVAKPIAVEFEKLLVALLPNETPLTALDFASGPIAIELTAVAPLLFLFPSTVELTEK